jgi:hypothetical protein
VVALGLIGTQLPLRLPDGNLPSPRWRWFSRVSILLIALSLVAMTVQPGRVEDVPGTANPLGVESLRGFDAVFLGVLFSFAVSLVALVGRYRRTGAHERVQLRWIAIGGVLFFVVYFVTLPLADAFGEGTVAAEVLTALSQAAFATLPISIGYAVLKHRLYDIGVVVNRALVYGGLTLALGTAYLGARARGRTGRGPVLGPGDRRLDARGGRALPPAAHAHPGPRRPPLLPRPLRRRADPGVLLRPPARRDRSRSRR